MRINTHVSSYVIHINVVHNIGYHPARCISANTIPYQLLWDKLETNVSLTKKFFSTDAVAFSNAHFGAGIGTIYLHIVSCTGRETNLTNCPQFSSSIYCLRGHSDDAGVRCQGMKDKHIMLLYLSKH